MANNDKIQFEHKGIGEVLSQYSLEVPLNQREYSWEPPHINDLFKDFIDAIDNKGGVHFLGTIVLTKATGDSPEVSDGQQRLTTTTILLAAIRDYFARIGDEARAKNIEHTYLMTNDLETANTIPRLQLNFDDRAFFTNYVLLSRSGSERKSLEPKRESHQRIKDAVDIAASFVGKITEPYKDENKSARLFNLVKFIKSGAQVIVLRVPDHMNAFTMFETLNDRGLKASQADLVKNYLLSHSNSRITDAQQNWAKMVGILDTLGLEDVTVTFLHHFLITKFGFIRSSEVFDKIKQTVNSQHSALHFLEDLSESANDYAALFNTDNKKWNVYENSVPKHIRTINHDLRVTQIRPMMFAAARHFSVAEANKAFRYFVSWSVRMLIAGVHGGILERNYAFRSHDIGSGKIKTADDLAKALMEVIPNDSLFENSFAAANVSQARLGRYYLRALEMKRMRESEPEFVPSDDEQSINLEHILPERPQQNWPGIDAETAKAYYKRIGNMALLQATKNTIIGNMNFEAKKPIFRASGFVMTSEVATYSDWRAEDIEKRQREMATLALKTWPITK